MNTSHPNHDQSGDKSSDSVDHHPMAVMADQSPRTEPSVDRHPTDPTARGPRAVAGSVDGDPSVTASPDDTEIGALTRDPSSRHEPTPHATSQGSKQKPKPCTCAAYRWPHRPGGGLCRWPDPPLTQHPTPAGTNRPTGLRRRGLRKSIMREYGLHPIRDREAIERLLLRLYVSVDRGKWPSRDGVAL